MKAPVFKGYGTTAARRGQMVTTTPTAVPTSKWNRGFYSKAYYISDYLLYYAPGSIYSLILVLNTTAP